MTREKALRTPEQVMRRNRTIRYWIFGSILLACAVLGPLLLRTPKQKSLPCFFGECDYFVPLRITAFSDANIPEVEIQIEDKTVLAKLDLGWDGGIALPTGMLSTLCNKTFVRRNSFFGIRGRTYESDIYELPEIRVGKMKVFPMRVEEESKEFTTDGVLEKGDERILEGRVGRAGWRVFRAFNLLLDCAHSTLIACDSLDTLRQNGYSVDLFAEAPLLLDRDSIDFEAMTERGPLRCVLDTGATWNFLNRDLDHQIQDHRSIDLDHLDGQPPEFNPHNEDLLSFNTNEGWDAKMFCVGERDFGSVYFLKMRSPLNFDAIIGMEFIESHLIFIDFRNQKIYFAPLPEERSSLVGLYHSIIKGGRKLMTRFTP